MYQSTPKYFYVYSHNTCLTLAPCAIGATGHLVSERLGNSMTNRGMMDPSTKLRLKCQALHDAPRQDYMVARGIIGLYLGAT